MPNRSIASGRSLATRTLASGRGIFARTLMTRATYNRTAIAALLSALSSARVDFVGVGDSNEAFSGWGWGWGFEYALAKRVGLFGTGLTAQNAYGTGTYQYFLSRQMGAISGAPSQLDQYINPGSGGMFPHHYSYVASSYAPFLANANHLEVPAFAPIDVTAALTFSLNYGTFTSGSGSFTPGVSNGLGGSIITSASAINTNTGAYGMSLVDVSVAADATRAGAVLCCGASLIGGSNIVGPYFGTFYRLHNPAKTAGACYSVLDFRGGKTLTDMATDFQQATDAYLTHFYSELRRLQGATKYVCHVINSGLNDQNDNTNLSVGPNPAITSTAAGFADNLQAIYARVVGIWNANGWPLTELFWLIMPGHPTGPPDSAALISYRTVSAKAFADANPRAAALDLGKVISPQQMAARQYYFPNTTGHLGQEGYQALALAAVDDLLAA